MKKNISFAWAALMINDVTILEFVEKNNTNLQQINTRIEQLKSSQTQTLRDGYNWNLTSFVESGEDKTPSTPTFTGSLSRMHSGGLELSKSWSSGLKADLGLSHSQTNKLGGYGFNEMSAQLEKELFPYFSGGAKKAELQSEISATQAQILDLQLSKRSIIRTQIEKFGRLQLLQSQIKSNEDLLQKYSTIVKSVQRKRATNIASAGEFEQAQAEFKLREANLKSLQQFYKNLIEEFTNDNKFTMTEKIEIAPVEFEKLTNLNQIEELLKRASQPESKNELMVVKSAQLKAESAELDYQSTKNKNKPVISLYGAYAQTGLDPSLASSFYDSQRDKNSRYEVGIKLVHEFNASALEQQSAAKLLNLNTQKKSAELTSSRIEDQIEVAKFDLQNAVDQLKFQSEVLDLRKSAMDQISRNYSQGRIDISLLFDAYNKMVQSEIAKVEALNDLRIKRFDLETLLVK